MPCSCCCPKPWPPCAQRATTGCRPASTWPIGSALASIGLTIPAVAAASVWLGLPLVLGAEAKDLVLLVLTVVVSSITLASGRTHVLQGAVHLVIFAAFLFLALVP